jgi:hypothetical protein
MLASLPYHREIDKFGATIERPRMFIVAVGVTHYAKTDWSLQYPAADAKDIGDRLSAVAKPLYAEPKVVRVLEGAATAKGGDRDRPVATCDRAQHHHGGERRRP